MSQEREFWEVKTEVLFNDRRASAKDKLKPSFTNVANVGALLVATHIFGPFSIAFWALEAWDILSEREFIKNQDKHYEMRMARAREKYSQANAPLEYFDADSPEHIYRLYNVRHGYDEFDGLDRF